jgi:Leucine-rich repeat (LRR) protein
MRQCVDDLGRYVQLGIPADARESVHSLCMDDCGITALPDAVALLRKLETLSACDNLLRILPRCLLDLSSLTVLRVSSCGLLWLPVDLGKRLPRLVELAVGGNKLRTLPCSLGRLAGTLTTLAATSSTLPNYGQPYCAEDADSARLALQRVERDFGPSERSRSAVLCFIAVFKFRRYEVVVPKDVVLIIARMIFAARNEAPAKTGAK